MRKIFVVFFLFVCAHAIPPGPQALLVLPTDRSWSGCASQQVKIKIRDASDAVDFTSFRLRVEGMIYNWPHAQLAWVGDSLLVFSPSTPFHNRDTVTVTLLRANDITGAPLQGDSARYEFYIDLDAPIFFPETRFPKPDTVLCRAESIAVKVLDRTSGIPFDGLCLCVNANNYSCSPNRSDGYCWQTSSGSFVYSDSTYYIDWSYFSAFDPEDEIEVCLRKALDYVAKDAPNPADVCGPHWFDTLDARQCWSFTRDCIGPRATLIFPSVGDTVGCDSIIVLFTDISHVETTTVILRVGGLNYDLAYSSWLRASANGDTAFFHGALSEGATNARVYSARDRAGNLSSGSAFPNWSIYVDKSAPLVSSPSPAVGAVVTTSTPTISIIVSDLRTRVNPSSLVMVVEGITYSYPHAALTWDGTRITFNTSAAGRSFIDGQVVDVCLQNACDIVRADRCGPNCMASPYCWSFTVDNGGPVATLLSPPNGAYSACNLQTLRIRLADVSGIDTSSISLTVEGIIYNHMSHMAMRGDTLIFTPSTPWVNGQIVDWSLTAARDTRGNGLATVLSGSFTVDLAPPVVSGIVPAAGTRFGASGLLTAWSATDALSGIVNSGTVLRIRGIPFAYPAGFTWDGVTLRYNLATSGLTFADGESVSVCLHIGDAVGSTFCGPNFRDTCTFFRADFAPPTLTLVNPPNAAISACATGQIKIRANDGAGVNRSTLSLRVNSTTYSSTSPSVSFRADTIIFTPPTAFAHGDTVRISVLALSDSLGNAITGTWSWFFVIDTRAPQITSISPVAGSRVASPSPTIRIGLADTPAGIDSLSLELSVEGIVKHMGDVGVSWSGGRLVLDCALAGITFADGTTVDVCLTNAADKVNSLLCGANVITRDSCWSFLVDRSGPTARLVYPDDGCFTSCASGQIRVLFSDPQGIIRDSTALIINGSTRAAWRGEIVMRGDTAVYTPATPFADGTTITVSAAQAIDSLYNRLASSDTWTFRIDISAPVFGTISPTPSSFLPSTNPTITFNVTDAYSGVSTTSLTFSARGMPYTGASTGVSFTGGIFSITPALLPACPALSNGDTLRMCIGNISDLARFCGANVRTIDTCITYFIDTQAPSANLIVPTSGTYFACSPESIIVAFTDNFGVDDTTVRLRINGITYAHGTGFTMRRDTVFLAPTLALHSGDTLTVSVLSARDFAGNSIAPTSWMAYADFSAPVLYSPSPAPETYIAAPTAVFSIAAYDTHSGVIPSSCAVFVNGSLASAGVSFDSVARRIVFNSATAGMSFASGDTLQICYRISDAVGSRVCGPNISDTACFRYFFDFTAPTAHVISPIAASYISCRNAQILIAVRDAGRVDFGSAVLRVNGIDYPLGAHLTVVSDTLLVFTPPSAFTEGTITVVLRGIRDAAGNNLAGDSLLYVFYTDFTPPQVTSFSPATGSIVSTSSPVVSVSLSDIGAGIADSSIVISLNGYTFTRSDACFSYATPTATINTALCGAEFFDGETVHFCARAIDRTVLCPANAMSDSCIIFTISSSGPTWAFTTPPAGAITSCTNQKIHIVLTDANGIDTASIRLSVNGTTHSVGDGELFYRDDTLRFVPTTPWIDGSTITVRLISARDRTGTAAIGLPVERTFRADFSPPQAFLLSPHDGSIIAQPDTTVRIRLTDATSGVNTSTIRIRHGARIISYSPATMRFSGDTLSFRLSDVGIVPTDGETLRLCLQNTADRATLCEPNVLVPLCFSLVFDYRGPAVNLVFPAESTFSSCTDSAIVWYLWDAAGIDSGSVRVSIDGREVDLSSPQLSYAGTFLVYNPDASFEVGRLLELTVLSANDVSGNSIAPYLRFAGFDTLPPTLTNVHPAASETITVPSPIFTVQIFDDAAGVFADSITLIVNSSETLSIAASELSFVANTLRADFATLGIRLADGEDTRICVHNVLDRAQNCGNNRAAVFCTSFHVISGATAARLVSPPNASVSSCPAESVCIELIDADGIDRAQTFIDISDGTFALNSPQFFDHDESTFCFVPTPPFAHGDDIRVHVNTVTDLLGNVATSFPEWHINFDTQAPQISIISATGTFAESIFVFDITDTPAGNDNAFLHATVNSSSADITLLDGHFTIDLASFALPEGAGVSVCIFARDLVTFCAPNDTIVCDTYIWDFTPPRAVLLTPSAGTISSCAAQKILWRVLDASSIADARAICNGETLSLGTSEFYARGDTLICAHTGIAHGDTISAQLIYIRDAAGNEAYLTAGTYFVADFIPPTLSSAMPAEGSTIASPSPVFRLFLTDTPAGINAASISATLNGTGITASWSGSFVLIDCGASGIVFADGDSVELCLSCTDRSTLCGANILSHRCLRYYISLTAPFAEIISPQVGEFVSCAAGEAFVRMLLTDADGIDSTSVIFSFDDDTFAIDAPELFYSSDTLFFAPESLPEGEHFCTLLAAADMHGNHLPSEIAWNFTVDTTHGSVGAVFPPAGAIATHVDSISVEIFDTGAGIDTANTRFQVNGTIFEPSALIWRGSRAVLIDSSFAELDGEINICISAPDLVTLCGANTFDTCYSFSISSERTFAEILFPQPSQIISCQPPDAQIRVILHSPTTFALTDIDFRIDGDVRTDFSLAGDTLIFVPDETFAHGETISVHLNAIDLAGNELELPLDYYFVIDLLPPNVTDVVACAETIRATVTDFPAGIDTATIYTAFTTNAETLIVPHIFEAGTLTFVRPVEFGALSCGETLRAIVRLSDASTACAANAFAQSYTCVAPSLEIINIFDGAVTSCARHEFGLRVEDAGSDVRFVATFEGETLYTDYFDLRADTFFFAPPFSISHGETITLDISSIYVHDILYACEEHINYVIDTQAPVCATIFPAPESVVEDLDNIYFVVHEDFTLDTTSLSLTVNGVSFALEHSALSFSGDTIALEMALSGMVFADGDTILACVHVCDLPDFCAPNCQVCCTRFSLNLPTFSAHALFPPSFATLSCAETTAIFVFNTSAGVNTASIVVEFNETTYTFPSPRLTLSGDTLRFRLIAPATDGIANLTLSMATDTLGNMLSSPARTIFSFDVTPPYVLAFSPHATASSAPQIWFVLDDSTSNVDFSSVRFRIGDLILPPTGFGALDTVFIDCAMAGLNFAPPETQLCIIFGDTPDFCTPNVAETCITIRVLPSADRPYAFLLTPPDGSILSCENTVIKLLYASVYDIVPESLGIILNGTDRYVAAHMPPRLRISADTIIFDGTGLWEHGTTVRFAALGCDEHNQHFAPEEWTMTFDFEPPQLTLQSPESVFTQSLIPLIVNLIDTPAHIDAQALSAEIHTPRGIWYFDADSAGFSFDGTQLTLIPDDANHGESWSYARDSMLLYFHERESIGLFVHTCDLATMCGENCTLATFSFWCEDDDTLPPQLIDYELVYDDELSAHLQLTCYDFSSYGNCAFAIVHGETLSLTPSGADTFTLTSELFDANASETLHVEIHVCDDDFDFELASDISETSFVLTFLPRSGEGPICLMLSPHQGDFISCAQATMAFLVTDADGVDTANAVFVCNDDTLAATWHGDTVYISPQTDWQSGDTVHIRALSLIDELGNPAPAFHFSFMVDLQAPRVFHTSGTVRDGQLNFSVFDSLSGALSAQIFCATETLDMPLPDFSIELLRLEECTDELLTVHIFTCDSATLCENNCTTYTFTFEMPQKIPCDAAPIPFTPNGDGKNDVAFFDFPSMTFSGATISIFTIEGILVTSLSCEPSSPKTACFWDGKTSDGNDAPPAIYAYIVTRAGKTICKGVLVLAR